MILIRFTFLLFLVSLGSVFGQDVSKSLQSDFITVNNGDTIHIPTGKILLNKSLWMEGKENVVIMGAGLSKSKLIFKSQKSGAEGIKIFNCKNISVIGLSVIDSKGDAIKVQETDNIYFRDVHTGWRGVPGKKNGSYGFYPVQCNGVTIEYCETKGASDAGIYVGQSKNVIVRKNKVWKNVAGIEIENCVNAIVYENRTRMNTGGILIFDMPGLQLKKGGNVLVRDNYVYRNNFRNFAPKGNIVGKVPPGTGIMILSTSNVELTNNIIKDNKTSAISIASYYISEFEFKDPDFDPYPKDIFIHDNTYSNDFHLPAITNKIGLVLFVKFGFNSPHIVYDGIMDPKYQDKTGRLISPHNICIQEDANVRMVNMDFGNNMKNIRHNITDYNCVKPSIKYIID